MVSLLRVVFVGLGNAILQVVHEILSQPVISASLINFPVVELILISNETSVLYTGMVPGIISKQYSENEASFYVPLSKNTCYMNWKGVILHFKLIFATAKDIDWKLRNVFYYSNNQESAISFDLIVVNTGSISKPISEYLSFPSSTSSSNIIYTRPLRQLLFKISQLDSISRPCNIFIIGAGCAAIEIAFCLQHRFQSKPFSFTVVNNHPSLASSVGHLPLSQKMQDELNRRSISLIQFHSLYSILDNQIGLLRGKDVSYHKYDFLILATGAFTSPFLQSTHITESNGFILVNQKLQSVKQKCCFGCWGISWSFPSLNLFCGSAKRICNWRFRY